MACNLQYLFPLTVFVACLVCSLETLRGDAKLSRPCNQDFESKIADCSRKGLGDVPQYLIKNIEHLDLSSNHIKSLMSFSFERYPRITNLMLYENDISVIGSTAFHPLKDLTYLDLSHNVNLVLPETGLFMFSRRLSRLILTECNLKTLPHDILKWTPNIETLNLGSNQFVSINISSCGSLSNVFLVSNQIKHLKPDAFTYACRTETIDLTLNPIKTVDPDVIASLLVRSVVFGSFPVTLEMMSNLSTGIAHSNIKQVSVTYANLSELSKEMFAPMKDHSLSVLDLSGNDVDVLHPLVFSSLKRVKELILSENRIITVDPEYFDGMEDLRILNFNSNGIQEINPYNHTWTVDLVKLFLSGNLFTNISASSFLGLENLALLDLSSNERLVSLELAAFSGLKNIQNIDLSFCGITHFTFTIPTLQSVSWTHMQPPVPLRPWSFKHLRSLQYIDLSCSDLSIFHIWNTRTTLFAGLMELKTLNLSGNPNLSILGTIPSGIFQQLFTLRELLLDNCAISAFEPLFFKDLKSLQRLSLKGNSIQQIKHGLLESMGQLVNINLEGNVLTYFDEAPFSSNTNLTHITLANNQITRLNASTFITSSLTSIDISMNPIVCNCDLEWLFDWLNGEINLIKENKTICSVASLQPLRKKPLLVFDPDEYCRSKGSAVFSLVPLAAVCLVCVVVLLHHHRWHLRYKLYLLKLAVLGYKELRDAREHNDYEFDVNIIFFDDDKRWIDEHLRPALQERVPHFQRNVFGDDDLMLGMFYLEAVDYVVTRSYKTIVVLTRAALRDRWFMLKFRTAMDHVNDTQTEFVMVVLLEDISADELPFLARLYLNDGRPYLHWDNDLRAQEYFWNELVKNLNRNILTNDLIPKD